MPGGDFKTIINIPGGLVPYFNWMDGAHFYNYLIHIFTEIKKRMQPFDEKLLEVTVL